MQLIRRCESHTCQGHCVCAAQDLKCTSDAETQDCIDKSGGEFKINLGKYGMNNNCPGYQEDPV